VSFHLWCDRLACEAHAEAPHDCGRFKGTSSIEEEAAEPEAERLLPLSEVTSAPFALRRRTPEARRAYLAEQRARHVEHGAPGAWLEVFDALAEETDRVAEAFRSEVRRQGLAPCEIQIDGQTEWLPGGGVRGRVEPDGPLHPGPGRFRPLGEVSIRPTTAGPVAYWPDPPAPPVDAALEPSYRRYECPRPGCDWIKLALDLDVLDGLLAEHETACHQPQRISWWSRLLPSRRAR